MKYLSVAGIWAFLLGGASMVESPTILGAILFLGGLIVTYISSRYWEWEDIT